MKTASNLNGMAVMVAMLGATPAAFALTPAQIAAGPTTYVWLAGSSSNINAVFHSMMALCKDTDGTSGPDDAHVYMQGAGVEPGRGSGDRVAYACTMGANAGSLAGKKVAVYHTVENGSFNAYSPHLKMAGDTSPHLLPSLQRINNLAGLGAGGQCASGAAVFDLPAPLDTVGRYNNCGVVTKNFNSGTVDTPGLDYPDGGFSDTEYLINQLTLGVSTNLSAIGTEVATNIAQAFGVAASYPLYYRLQLNDAAAGRLDAATCTTGFSATAPNLALVCQPSLTYTQYMRVAAQNTIAGVDGSTFGGPPGSKVNLIRRVPTSGAQSASNIRFLAKPCSTGGLEPARASDSTATVTVTEQSSTSGVKTALNTATQAGEYGLGVVSMENVPEGVAANDRWAFVKLNRVSPNSDAQQRAEAMAGNYHFWYELAAFTAGGASPASAAGAELIAALTTTMSETDLDGLFATAASGLDPNQFVVSATEARFGNSCSLP